MMYVRGHPGDFDTWAEGVCVRAKAGGASRVYWNTGEANASARALYDKVATLTKFVQYRKNL